eukprot:3867293-Rhodomonas_salina.2
MEPNSVPGLAKKCFRTGSVQQKTLSSVLEGDPMATPAGRALLRREGGARTMLRNLLLLVAIIASHSAITCPDPSIQNSYSCNAASAHDLMFTAPSEWYKLSPDADMELGAGPWLHDSAACCKHCVWNLGYPLIDPIVIATDRTNTNASQHLDCTKFEVRASSLHLSVFLCENYC